MDIGILESRCWYDCISSGSYVFQLLETFCILLAYDLLFYHLELRCYVVVELKNVDFKPDFVGQLQFYITAVDETLKKEMDNSTIGLLLCKGKDKYSVEWSLKATTAPIGVASYEVRNYLPTEEELNRYLK